MCLFYSALQYIGAVSIVSGHTVFYKYLCYECCFCRLLFMCCFDFLCSGKRDKTGTVKTYHTYYGHLGDI